MERWTAIHDQPSYSVSNYGRVRNDRFDRLLRPSPNGRSGQLAVRLGMGGTGRDYYVHRLVAEHFLSDFNPSLQYVHADGDVTHNTPDNLVPRQFSAAPRRGGRTKR